MRDKILKNMSERASQNLVEEIEMLGPVRLKAVEEAQAEVVRAIRALEEAGQIVVTRGADDEFVCLTRAVLRGIGASQAQPARLDVDLRTSPLASGARWTPGCSTRTWPRCSRRPPRRVRAEAYDDGFARGLRAGAAAGRAEADAERAAAPSGAEAEQERHDAAMRSAVVALRAAARQLEQRGRGRARRRRGRDRRRGADPRARGRAGTSWPPGRGAAHAALRRALALAPDGAPVVVRLHPDDVATVAGYAETLGTHRVTVVARRHGRARRVPGRLGAVHVDAQPQHRPGTGARRRCGDVA